MKQKNLIDQQNQEFRWSSNKAIFKMQKYFKFDQFQTTLKKELLGGLTTFLALVYILSVNSDILSQSQSINDPNVTMNEFGIFFATAITSIVATLLMGLWANVPIVMSPGMGMNTLFTFTLAQQAKLGFEGAMIAVLLASILFFIITVTPMRAMILQAIPKSLSIIFAVSIAFFIAYVGFEQMGWFKMDANTQLPIASLATFKENYLFIILGMATLGLMLFFHYRKVNGGVALSIVIGFIICIIFANTLPKSQISKISSANFRNGFNFHYDFEGFIWNIKSGMQSFANPKVWSNPGLYVCVLVVMLMSFFDDSAALNTLNMQRNKGLAVHHEVNRPTMLIDAGSGIMNGILGVSSMSVMVESSAGIHQGAKTGVAALVNVVLFGVAIVLFPVFATIPTVVTGAACVFIGILMVLHIAEIEWHKPQFAIPAFLAIIFSVTTFTIVNGVAIAILSYAFIMLIIKKAKQVHILIWPLCLVLLAYFVALAFIQ
ncbi:NCS2 family permease [Williamsoniiplasma lucivorax]|uniref:Xanthine/uracil permease n=1 Tax=Williamsoniiplasma lucivorax TaxID=209274 RepID=A0A2S5RD18_9MOLU|nr:NCS2 family permease [Williamsoniiplasma lucivorax]PPE05216.1 xanthine/uracil permease [Williamsoniiplasma lucivorax]